MECWAVDTAPRAGLYYLYRNRTRGATEMETFDDISCEEYNAAFGTDEEQFQEWVRDVEQAILDDVNCELRELAAAR